MRLVSYATEGHPAYRAGVLVGSDSVMDLAATARTAGLPDAQQASAREVRGFLSLGDDAWSAVAGVLDAGGGEELRPLDSVRLGPPVPNPEKVICVGLNYRDHAEEAGLPVPSAPILFAKFSNSLIGPRDEIMVPHAVGDEVDYEAELAVVFGRTCCEVDEAHALDCLAGVMAFNDVSARHLQMRTSQWTLGKAIDTFAPCGPALVSLDEIEEVQALNVRARVNGETVQSGNSASMIFSIAQTIAYLSRLMTFVPGDLIATGTPAGTGMGRTPPLTLQPGDLVEVEVEGVGTLSNHVVARPAAASRVGANALGPAGAIR